MNEGFFQLFARIFPQLLPRQLGQNSRGLTLGIGGLSVVAFLALVISFTRPEPKLSNPIIYASIIILMLSVVAIIYDFIFTFGIFILSARNSLRFGLQNRELESRIREHELQIREYELQSKKHEARIREHELQIKELEFCVKELELRNNIAQLEIELRSKGGGSEAALGP
jgi:hypothetical protein